MVSYIHVPNSSKFTIVSKSSTLTLESLQVTGGPIIGLTLKKTPSFINLAEKALSNTPRVLPCDAQKHKDSETKGDDAMDSETKEKDAMDSEKNKPPMTKKPKAKKQKVSIFDFSSLRIGTWETVGDQ
ncbi:hypothetical protein AMTR_s00045p00179960 [Amborella trichopoda]|uniref:Uncharacterized protein n=1 Tax=Amborella trichopoda TaxID=13333 RepID=W1P5A0_AMBTC|nr:hypothetical protein AMTR_s00045p00179960 [Amborella trichopoda]